MATADLKDIKGIVLREFKYKESSKIIEVFTEDLGKISINCQGVLKKNAKKEADKNYVNIFLGFFLKYISFSGFKPNFKTCGICGKNIRGKYLYFSPNESSVICDECKDKVFDKVFMTYEEFIYFNKLLYTKSEELKDIKLVDNYQKIAKIIIDYCLKNLEISTYSSLEWVKKALERNVNVF